ncbi:MAG: hypothetical protein ACTSSG_03805 [Candidatus Heimdallarchaeaceae archaeon]
MSIIETCVQLIKLKINPKIIAKTITAIPISNISSRIGPPLLFLFRINEHIIYDTPYILYSSLI